MKLRINSKVEIYYYKVEVVPPWAGQSQQNWFVAQLDESIRLLPGGFRVRVPAGQQQILIRSIIESALVF
jgi:hypothetical protein